MLALVRAVGAVLCVGMGSSDTSAAVEEVEGVELARLRASWGRMGSTHSAKGTGSEWGVSLCIDGVSDAVGDVEEHGDNNVIICDVAVDGVGSGCSAGDRRMGWGGVGGTGDGAGHRWRWWVWQESSIEGTMSFDEHSCLASRDLVSSAV